MHLRPQSVCAHLCGVQASADRGQDEKYYADQQALLQKQLADLKLTAEKYGAESGEAYEGLSKKRLKMQQEVEVRPLASAEPYPISNLLELSKYCPYCCQLPG